jgi:hypothetical protein
MASVKWCLPLIPFIVTGMFGQSATPAFEVASVKRNPDGQGPNADECVRSYAGYLRDPTDTPDSSGDRSVRASSNP